MIINGEEGRRYPLAVEVPVEAIGRFAHEIEHKRGNFQIGEEIIEDQWLSGVYEDSGIHVANIMLL